MDPRVSKRLIVHRHSDRDDQPQKFMFDPARGVALFDLNSHANARSALRSVRGETDFIPNAAIIDADGSPVHWITGIRRKGSMSSHFVNIEHEGNRVFLVCFRGERFELDVETCGLSRTGYYQKY
jgi:hypothetical protein